jgi:hypothetical protein
LGLGLGFGVGVRAKVGRRVMVRIRVRIRVRVSSCATMVLAVTRGAVGSAAGHALERTQCPWVRLR